MDRRCEGRGRTVRAVVVHEVVGMPAVVGDRGGVAPVLPHRCTGHGAAVFPFGGVVSERAEIAVLEQGVELLDGHAGRPAGVAERREPLDRAND